MTITMQQIAEKTGVSRITVSRALNNRSRISQETRRKILKEARRLNYRPNAVAKALAMKKTHTIGLVVPDITNPFVAEITKHVEDRAAVGDYSLIMCVTNNSLKKEDASIRSLMDRRVDGIIINHPQSNAQSQCIRQLKQEKFPFVLIGTIDGMETDYVMVDLAEGAYQAVSHLIRQGHKRIAYVRGGNGRLRLMGYKKALAEHGLGFDEELVVRCGPGLKDGAEAAGKILAMQDRPTAIFALNDFLAMGVMDALKAANLNVPEDMALVGFDDVLLASRLSVPLTTIAQPMEQIGKLAVEILMKKIEKPTHEPWQVMLKPQLVIRESCGAKSQQSSQENT
ncbi:MAG: LacI family transcriptional regulator [Phycisphaerae bacterium]|nr:LacI family transcriptional regulator [Phycisphaerae bacterium]